MVGHRSLDRTKSPPRTLSLIIACFYAERGR